MQFLLSERNCSLPFFFNCKQPEQEDAYSIEQRSGIADHCRTRIFQMVRLIDDTINSSWLAFFQLSQPLSHHSQLFCNVCNRILQFDYFCMMVTTALEKWKVLLVVRMDMGNNFNCITFKFTLHVGIMQLLVSLGQIEGCEQDFAWQRFQHLNKSWCQTLMLQALTYLYTFHRMEKHFWRLGLQYDLACESHSLNMQCVFYM